MVNLLEKNVPEVQAFPENFGRHSGKVAYLLVCHTVLATALLA
jgi:hypothetical protein